MKLIDLSGKRFGRLLVINKHSSFKGHVKWLCKCDCGNECVVQGSSLKSGNTTSCGCYKREYSKELYSTVRQNDKHLYAVWNGIKQRCFNKNNKSYKNYGGRGITMDKEWANNYESFYKWAIQSGYKQGFQIDRIDNNLGYCESNCRFVNNLVQANNKRNVKFHEINGVSKTLSEWCREYNMDYFLVRQRVFKLGWNIEKALTTPVDAKLRKEKTHESII